VSERGNAEKSERIRLAKEISLVEKRKKIIGRKNTNDGRNGVSFPTYLPMFLKLVLLEFTILTRRKQKIANCRVSATPVKHLFVRYEPRRHFNVGVNASDCTSDGLLCRGHTFAAPPPFSISTS
jgi:hypothetical protein